MGLLRSGRLQGAQNGRGLMRRRMQARGVTQRRETVAIHSSANNFPKELISYGHTFSVQKGVTRPKEIGL